MTDWYLGLRSVCAFVPMTAIFAAAEMGSHVAAQSPDDRPAVLVNPRAVEGKTATTIQEGIEMATPGGKVLVLPGIYHETLNVTKGVTIEAIGGRSGDVIIARSRTRCIPVGSNGTGSSTSCSRARRR